MKKEIYVEAEALEPIVIEFKELGYDYTEFRINYYDGVVNFAIRKNSVIKIVDTIRTFCKAFFIDMDNCIFETSQEMYNVISKKNLSNTKTVIELFAEQGIEIKQIGC